MEVLITRIKWDLEGQPETEVSMPKVAIMFDVPGPPISFDTQEGISQSLSNAFGFQHNGYQLNFFDAHNEMDADDPFYFPRDMALCLYQPPTDGVSPPPKPTTYVVLGPRNSENATSDTAVNKISELLSRNSALIQELAAARRDLWRFRVVAADARGALLAANGAVTYQHLRNWTKDAAEQLAGIIEDTAAAAENA